MPDYPTPGQSDFSADEEKQQRDQGRLLFDPAPLGPQQKFPHTSSGDATGYNRIWEGGDESRLQNQRGDILVGKLT